MINSLCGYGYLLYFCMITTVAFVANFLCTVVPCVRNNFIFEEKITIFLKNFYFYNFVFNIENNCVSMYRPTIEIVVPYVQNKRKNL